MVGRVDRTGALRGQYRPEWRPGLAVHGQTAAELSVPSFGGIENLGEVRLLVIPPMVIAAAFALACLYAGVHELALGRPVPGRFWRGYFPRRGPRRSDSWSSKRWRLNGFLVIDIGLSSGMLSLWLALFAAKVI